MAIKQISLFTGSSDLDFISRPHSAAQDGHIDVQEAGAIGKVQRHRSSGVTYCMGRTVLPTSPSSPSTRIPKTRRKSDTVRLRELQTLVPLSKSALKRMAKDVKFVKPAGGVEPRKWSRNAIHYWLAGMKQAASRTASNSYGTSNDPDPEIRQHMAAILHDSIHSVG